MEMSEDDFTDILRKAMIGNALPPAELARRAETSLAALNRFQKGQFDETLARQIATVLGLDADAFASEGPSTNESEGLLLFFPVGKECLHTGVIITEFFFAAHLKTHIVFRDVSIAFSECTVFEHCTEYFAFKCIIFTVLLKDTKA
jgi:hypothetical protein